MGKHSPRPWRQLDVERIVDAGGYLVARVSGQINEGSYEVNGALIASAPELLASVRRFAKQTCWVNGTTDGCGMKCGPCEARVLLSRLEASPQGTR